MQYQFTVNNNGLKQANFDEEHQLMGYWLMSNYSDDIASLDRLIIFSNKLEKNNVDDFQISNKGYYLQLTTNTAKLIGLSILENPLLANQENQPDLGKMDFDNQSECECELKVFNEMLTQWRDFVAS